MRMTWINHASFIVEHGGVRLITDPWIAGTAFDDGWKLLSPSGIGFDGFGDITHIWFSHEHPDHFSPPNLKRIPPEARARITVLFQRTRDRRVAEFCRRAGFREVVELDPDREHRVARDFAVRCQPFTDGDSWLYIDTGQCRILNVNDCIIRRPAEARAVRRAIGPVDVLMTQFSYASKVGNAGDTAMRREAAAEKLRRIAVQAEVFRPSTIVPFASFVWWCHAENYYNNDGNTTIGEVYGRLTREHQARIVVLYPGDEWTMDGRDASLPAIERYQADHARIANGPELLTSAPVSEDDLTAIAASFVAQLRELNHPAALDRLEPARIHLTDQARTYRLSLARGLEPAEADPAACDIAVSSSALGFAFRYLYGGDTLNVNARFQIPPRGDYRRIRRYFTVASMNNRGERLEPSGYRAFLSEMRDGLRQLVTG